MNLAQIVEVLPLQVYVRRGELVIQFSTPSDLINRLEETTAAISDLGRQLEGPRTDGKPERGGRRGNLRAPSFNGGRTEAESEGPPAYEPDPPGRSG